MQMWGVGDVLIWPDAIYNMPGQYKFTIESVNSDPDPIYKGTVTTLDDSPMVSNVYVMQSFLVSAGAYLYVPEMPVKKTNWAPLVISGLVLSALIATGVK